MSEEKQESKKEEKVEAPKKLNLGVGADIGTATIVVAREKADGSFSIRHHRNMLYRLGANEEAADLLDRGGYLYVKSGEDYYIVGNDALTFANAIGGGEIIRPMQDGLLNPKLTKARKLLFHIVKMVVGDPEQPGETLRFSLPANPVDRGSDFNNEFHESVLRGFFLKMGYEPKPINEAMANLVMQTPSMATPDGIKKNSGYSISFGGGMSNSCVAIEGVSISQFSNTGCGDFIDRQAAQMTGKPVGIVMRIKEKSVDLNLDDLDYDEDIDEDNIRFSISTYYSEMMRRVLRQISEQLSKKDHYFEGPLDIVVCGGTSLAPGFVDRLKKVIATVKLPFEVKDVKLAKDPFYSVAQGACLAARGDWEKSKKGE